MQLKFLLVYLTLSMPVPSEERFRFVDHSIAAILRRPNQGDFGERRNLIETRTLRILYKASGDAIDRETLMELAQASDSALFDQVTVDMSSMLRPLLLGLVHVCHENVAAATLLALNSLESAIRNHTGHTTGNAPLLKSMLQQLEDRQLAPILKCLLLPHDGLNLRNLLWHGFVPSLPRPWFSLVVVLIYNMEKHQDHVSVHSLPVLRDLRAEAAVSVLLEERLTDANVLHIRAWIPVSHQDLFDLSIKWSEHYPACAAALLAILLEHCLRVEWCRCNDRPTDCIAQPDAYYVTLDGHGQRNQHELLLHPYYLKCQRRNAMVSHLGGGTIALLTDLFASSCGGPNIRSALSHGMWDANIEKEVCCRMTGSNETGNDQLRDMVRLMLLNLHHIATKSPLKYKPQFSYTATTIRCLVTALEHLEHLESLQKSIDLEQIVYQEKFESSGDTSLLQVSTSTLRQSMARLRFGTTSGEWTCDNVFDEYESNVILSDCTAARMLLSEIAVAAASYRQVLDEAVKDIAGDLVSSRRRRRSIRLVIMVNMTLSLYTFVVRVALLDIESKLLADTKGLAPDLLLKAVERSRMCLSTFVTFLPTNYERATKSVTEFMKGKPTRAVLQTIHGESNCLSEKSL